MSKIDATSTPERKERELFDKVPKWVLFQIARQFASKLDAESYEDAIEQKRYLRAIFDEWCALHIASPLDVPKPPKYFEGALSK